jgi:hypothetical protein
MEASTYRQLTKRLADEYGTCLPLYNKVESAVMIIKAIFYPIDEDFLLAGCMSIRANRINNDRNLYWRQLYLIQK